MKTLESVARPRGILIIAPSNEVPSTYINVSQFDQIVLNLFTNSIEQIPLIRKQTGKIEIGLQYMNNENIIKMRFSDNGPGIHEKYLDKVFDLLFTTKPNGTGLGLYISKNLIESMNGKIYIENNIRFGGVTFVLEIPLRNK